MKRHRRKLVLAAVVFMVLYVGSYLISMFCGETDYQRVLRGAEPAFAREKWFFTDGGTTVYRGFGYTVVRIHSIHDESQTDNQGHASTLFESGASLRYKFRWLYPFDRRLDRKHTEITAK